MKPGIPWSVKGIEPDMREAAKNAARRSGMTLGEWLNAAIVEQAEPEKPALAYRAPAKPPRSRISTHPIERAATRLEDIAEQLARIAQRESDTTASRHMPQPQALEDTGTLARVLGRIESNERQTVEAFSAVNDRLSVLGRQFAKVQAPPPAPRPEESAGYQSLEKAMRNIVEHLEVSEKRNRDNLKSLQDRMSEMAAKANGAGSEQVLRQAPAFNQLEQRLSDLARRVDTVQQPSADMPEVLRRELDSLASRIEDVRDTAESLAGKAQTQAVQQAQNELRSIEGRILGLLREAQTSMAAHATGPAEIQRFRSEIDKLHNRIDDASNATASGQEVSTLRQAVEQLSTRVAQGQDPRPFAEMDRRIVDIANRLEQTQAATRDMPQFNELDRRMAELDHRLNEAMRLQGEGPAREDLEQKLAEVDSRLAQTEHQLKHLETIERAINQLYESIEHGRSHAAQVAEEAATRMAQNIMAQGPQAVSLAGSPEIMALEQGLHAVREASQTADSRNQETLEAVHETLEQIVTKLAELETAAIGQRVAHATAPAVAPFIAAPQVTEPSPFGAPQATSTPFAASESLEPEHVANNPFGAPEAPPESLASNPFTANVEPISANEDFVALARRVAQSATPAVGLGAATAGLRKPTQTSSLLSGLNLPFLKGKKVETTIPSLAGDMKPSSIKPAANNNIAGNKRRLVLMGLVLLTMISAGTVFRLGQMRTPAPAEPVAITAPAVEQQAPVAPADAAPAQIDDNASANMPTAAQPPADAGSPQPVPAPLAAPAKKATGTTSGQHSENIDPSQSDPILTGALPSSKVPVAGPAPAALESAIGSNALRDAAVTGDAMAQFVVATRYLNGENVTLDYAKAAYWYGKAAASGLAPAEYRIATLYERGKGVNLDLKTALSWYERAGALGNVKAMHNAAVIAAGNGAGTPDYAAAFKWFSLAAAHGLKDSQFNLAVLMERGLGTKADATEAYFWYLAAAAQGDHDAQTRADQLAKTLSSASVEAAKTKLQTWTPEKAPDEANVVSVDESKWQPKLGPRIQQGMATPKSPVITAQDMLEKLGYNIGVHDGKLEGKTANAIRLFQLQKGLPVTGKVTSDLLNAMQSSIS